MDELECESGCNDSVGFASGTLYDADGKEMFCKCGKPSTCCIMGNDAYSVMCNECMYGKNMLVEPLFLKMPE